MNKDAIIDFLQKNPGWILQFCHGIGGNGWWWLINMNGLSETIEVDGRSAKAARNMLRLIGPYRFGETNYGL